MDSYNICKLKLRCTFREFHSNGVASTSSINIDFFFVKGSSAGAAFTYFICGYIIDWYGWEWVFYITGVLGFAWSVAWAAMVFDTPQEHPWISEKERNYIEDSIGNSLNRSKVSGLHKIKHETNPKQ